MFLLSALFLLRNYIVFFTSCQLCVGCHYNAQTRLFVQPHNNEACKQKFDQLIWSLCRLHIDNPIHKILLSDWLNLDGRDSLLIADLTSIITKQREQAAIRCSYVGFPSMTVLGYVYTAPVQFSSATFLLRIKCVYTVPDQNCSSSFPVYTVPDPFDFLLRACAQ